MVDLQEIEAIKRLKYRYMRCLDLKRWDEMSECFVEEATASYSGGKYAFTGRAAILDFFTQAMGRPGVLSAHHVHHPEIDLTGRDQRARHVGAGGHLHRRGLGRDDPRRGLLRGRVRQARRKVEDPAHGVSADFRRNGDAQVAPGPHAHAARFVTRGGGGAHAWVIRRSRKAFDCRGESPTHGAAPRVGPRRMRGRRRTA